MFSGEKINFTEVTSTPRVHACGGFLTGLMVCVRVCVRVRRAAPCSTLL